MEIGMKRLKLIFVLLITAGASVFADGFLKSTELTLHPGAYCKYRYTYDGSDYIIMFSYLGGNELLMTYHFGGNPDERGYMIMDLSLEGDAAQKTVKRGAWGELEDIHVIITVQVYNAVEFYLNNYDLNYPALETKSIPDPFYEGDIEYDYNKWIPLFNLYGIRSLSDDSYLMELVDVGFMREGAEWDDFFVTPIERRDDPFGQVLDFSSPYTSSNLGIPLDLNSQWVWVENNHLGAPAYFLRELTEQDALLIGFAREDELTDDLIATHIAYTFLNSPIDPSSFSVAERGGRYYLYDEIIDPASGYVTVDRQYYMPLEKGYRQLIFNGFLSLYEANREHFDSLFHPGVN